MMDVQKIVLSQDEYDLLKKIELSHVGCPLVDTPARRRCQKKGFLAKHAHNESRKPRYILTAKGRTALASN